MAAQPRDRLPSVPEGKPRGERLGGPSEPVTVEDWFADPPDNTTAVEVAPGVLAPPGPRHRQHVVDIPAEPGSGS
jgi:hypothetical protein